MDGRAKQRLTMYLRSERAMGQPSVPGPKGGIRRGAPEASAPPAVGVRPAAVAATAPSAAATKRSVSGDALLVSPSAPRMTEVCRPIEVEELPIERKKIALEALNANEVHGCTRCRLHETRTNTVFGEGSPQASIFFIGEGPGENEDQTGRPFVGRAGQLLDKMIGGMGLRREDVFIANIVKCRPPGNRVPLPDEVATCTPYLERQLEIVRPKVIVTLGLPALKYMMCDQKLTMGRSRGQWREWRGIKLMPTFHPAYVLRQYTEEVRAAVWSDLQQVMVELGMPIPKRGKGS